MFQVSLCLLVHFNSMGDTCPLLLSEPVGKYDLVSTVDLSLPIVTHLFCKVRYSWNMIMHNSFLTELFRTIILINHQPTFTDHLLYADTILSALHALIRLYDKCLKYIFCFPFSFFFLLFQAGVSYNSSKKQLKSEIVVVSINCPLNLGISPLVLEIRERNQETKIVSGEREKAESQMDANKFE